MKPFKTDTKHSHINPESIDRTSPTSKYLIIAYSMVKKDKIPEEILNLKSFSKHYQLYKESLSNSYSENIHPIHPCARTISPEQSREMNDFPKRVRLAEILVQELDKINWPIN